MKTNYFAQTACKLIERCHDANIEIPDPEREPVDVSFIQECLPHLSIGSGYELMALLPGWGEIYRCYLFVRPKGAELPHPLSIFDCLTDEGQVSKLDGLFRPEEKIVTDGSPEGIWEMFLLSDVWHFLPLWGDANSERMVYIMDADRLIEATGLDSSKWQLYPDEDTTSRIGFECNGDIRAMHSLVGDESLLPSVIKDADDSARIIYSYWTPWGGLVRATVPAEINGGTVTFGRREVVRLADYQCGICF